MTLNELEVESHAHQAITKVKEWGTKNSSSYTGRKMIMPTLDKFNMLGLFVTRMKATRKLGWSGGPHHHRPRYHERQAHCSLETLRVLRNRVDDVVFSQRPTIVSLAKRIELLLGILSY